MVSSSRQTPCKITAIAILHHILLSSASSNSHFAAKSVPIPQHFHPISFMKTFFINSTSQSNKMHFTLQFHILPFGQNDQSDFFSWQLLEPPSTAPSIHFCG